MSKSTTLVQDRRIHARHRSLRSQSGWPDDALLSRRVDDPEVVADPAAESFAQALIGASRVDRQRGTADAWLYGNVAHQLYAYWRTGAVRRRAQRRLAMERQPVGDVDLAELDSPGDEVALPMLADLPEAQRAAVREHVIRGHTYEQMARATGLDEATLRKRVSRGLASLRLRLRGEGPYA